MIYLASFLISALFAWKANSAKSKKCFIIFSILSIACTVILATLRNDSVGTDVINYRNFETYWNGAINSKSLGEYFSIYRQNGYTEWLFALYVGCIAKLTGSYRVFLFLSHLIIVSCIYVGAFRQKKHANPVVILLIFYLCFYNQSLNIIRQYMAMAIVFAFLADIEARKHIRYLIFVAIAMMIHNTAFLGIGALMIYWALYTPIPNYHLSIAKRKWIICGGLSAVVLGFVPLCKLLVKIGALNSKYLYYLSGKNATYGIVDVAFLTMELILVFIVWKNIIQRDEYANFFLINSVSCFILYQITGVVPYGKRIAAYFYMTNLVTLAMIGESQKNRKLRYLLHSMVILGSLCYWVFCYVYRNAGETYPYIIRNWIFY